MKNCFLRFNWFDHALKIATHVQANHLRSLQKKLYNDIFMSGEGRRHRNRQQRLDTIEAFLANLAASCTTAKEGPTPIAIPMTYERWVNSRFQFSHINDVFRHLQKEGLLRITVGYYDRQKKHGRCTRILPSEKMVGILQGTVGNVSKLAWTLPEAVVIMKDQSGKAFTNYKKTVAVRKLIKSVEQINQKNASHDILYHDQQTQSTSPVNPYVYAVFNNDSWESAGRFYGGIGSHIHMSKSERQYITIDGDYCIEMDYRSIHVMLAYAKAGYDYVGNDPYACIYPKAELRPVLKHILLCLLNNDCSEKQFISQTKFTLFYRHYGINRHDNPIAYEVARTECYQNKMLMARHNLTVEKVVARFKEAHYPIAEFFHTGTWREMHNIDSKIALQVMLAMTRRHKTACLPIHDSFLVNWKFRDVLHDEMKRAFAKITSLHFGRAYDVEIKVEMDYIAT